MRYPYMMTWLGNNTNVHFHAPSFYVVLGVQLIPNWRVLFQSFHLSLHIINQSCIIKVTSIYNIVRG